MWGQILTSREVGYCRRLLNELANVQWCAQLVDRLNTLWPPSYADKALLFELRFAAEVHRAGVSATYEFPTGVGDSTVDFRLEGRGAIWLVELVSVMTSDAVRRATVERGLTFTASIGSDAEDPRQTIAGEMILVQQKIGEKVVGKEGPTKFPPPVEHQFHAVVADIRGFGITGGDIWDYRQIAYGPAGVEGAGFPATQFWRTDSGAHVPVQGLFDPNNRSQRAAPTIQERLHFLGFTRDELYEHESLRQTTMFLANPHRFVSADAALEAYRAYPLLRL